MVAGLRLVASLDLVFNTTACPEDQVCRQEWGGMCEWGIGCNFSRLLLLSRSIGMIRSDSRFQGLIFVGSFQYVEEAKANV